MRPALAAALLAGCATAAPSAQRFFPAPAGSIYLCAVEGIRAAGLSLDRDEHDAVGGVLIASDPGHGRIRLAFRAQDAETTRISLEFDPAVERKAMVVLDHIADAAGRGVQVEETYPVDLPTALEAARKAFQLVRLQVTHERVQNGSGLIEAGFAEGMPIHVRLDALETGRTLVRFIAGHSKTPGNRRSMLQVKAAFEKSLPKR